MSNTKNWVIAAAIVLSLIAIGVAITARQAPSDVEDLKGYLEELTGRLDNLGASVSSETGRSGTGTDFTELGFGQVRTGKFWLVSSTTAAGHTNRLAWTNRTGQKALVSLDGIKLFTTDNATTSRRELVNQGNSLSSWRVFAATGTSATDNTSVPDFGTISATTTLLGAPWIIYDGTGPTSTPGILLAPRATSSLAASQIFGPTVATTTYDGANGFPEEPVTSMVIEDGESLVFTIRNIYGIGNCGGSTFGGTNNWLNSGLSPCESATSSQIGFILNVVGEYEYRNPLK